MKIDSYFFINIISVLNDLPKDLEDYKAIFEKIKNLRYLEKDPTKFESQDLKKSIKYFFEEVLKIQEKYAIVQKQLEGRVSGFLSLLLP